MGDPVWPGRIMDQGIHPLWRSIFGPVCMGVIIATHAAQAKSGIIEPWGTVFAEEQVSFHLHPGMPVAGWSLVLSDVIAARGENSTIELTFPPLRDGVVVTGMINIQDFAGTFSKPIWLFSRKPECPALDNVRIFDPKGKTVPVLASNGIIGHPVLTVNGLADATNGILIVGAGISTDEAKDVAPAVFAAAARGARILWLAPAPGRMKLPGEETGIKPAMEFRDADIISRWDKRLHPEDWRLTKAIETSFRLVGDRRVVEMEWNATDSGWCWLDARWPSGGRLVICGISIVAAWEDNPAPRYLMAAWLFDLNKTQ